MKETVYSIGLTNAIIFSSIFFYSAFQANSAIIVLESGFLTTSWGGMFMIMADLLIFSAFFYLI